MLQNLTGLPNIIWNQCSQKFLFNSKDCVIRTYVRDEATAMPSVESARVVRGRAAVALQMSSHTSWKCARENCGKLRSHVRTCYRYHSNVIHTWNHLCSWSHLKVLCMSEYLVSTNVADIQYHFNHTAGGYLETLATTQCQTGKCINMQHTCTRTLHSDHYVCFCRQVLLRTHYLTMRVDTSLGQSLEQHDIPLNVCIAHVCRNE